MDILRFVFDNRKEIIDTIAYIVLAASVIVKLTPTLKDDNFFKPIIKFVGKWLALDKYGPNAK
jgi:hypothetical protein